MDRVVHSLQNLTDKDDQFQMVITDHPNQS